MGSTALSSYVHNRGSTSGGEALQTILPPTTTSYTDTTTAPGSTYFWDLQAVGGGGVSPLSSEVSLAVAAAAPSNVTLGGSASSSSVVLTMAGVAQGAPITSFTVQRAALTGGVPGAYSTIGTATPGSSPATGMTSATYTDSTPVSGTQYDYQVIANTTAGNTTSAAAGPYQLGTASLVQSNSAYVQGAPPSVTLPSAPTPGNTLVFVAQGDTGSGSGPGTPSGATLVGTYTDTSGQLITISKMTVPSSPSSTYAWPAQFDVYAAETKSATGAAA